jgi:hypothetical protein
MDKHFNGIKRDQPQVYRIILQGWLGPEWVTTFGNLDLQNGYAEDGTLITILSGNIMDQAALHGILQEIRDLGLMLLLVEYQG